MERDEELWREMEREGERLGDVKRLGEKERVWGKMERIRNYGEKWRD